MDFTLPSYEDTTIVEPLSPALYKVQIESVEIKPTKKNPDRKGIHVLMSAVDAPEADLIYHYMNLPVDEDDKRTVNMMNSDIKNFTVAFGVDSEDGSFDTDTWMDATCDSMPVEIGEWNGKKRNEIKPPPFE